ncbi:MAG: GNAT family N-acetyltransferase [Roseimicrobium sp.]
MNASIPVIQRMATPVSAADLSALAALLVSTVESGAAISFLSPISLAEAEQWWCKTTSSAANKAVFLLARGADGICGSVQMHPAWAPNQPHRAEIAKLMVHPRCRRSGLGTRLMTAIEDAARELGFGLLTLDTKKGSSAEQLYRRLGWAYVGTIPDFALEPDRSALHDDVIFYKVVNAEAARRALPGHTAIP